MSFTPQTLLLINTTLVLAFSISLAIVERSGGWRVKLWLASNLSGVAGIIIIILGIAAFGDRWIVYGGIFNLTSVFLKAVCLGGRRLPWHLPRKVAWPIMLMFVFSLVMLVPAASDFRFAISCTCAIMGSAGVLAALRSNRAWRGLRGVTILCSAMIVNIVQFSTILATAYPIGFETRMFGDNQIVTATLLVMTLVSFFFQISFLSLIIQRRERERMFAERRTVRAVAFAGGLLRSREEIAALSEERHGMLKLLAHEVRQPLNNAQAALQTLMNDLDRGANASDKLKDVAIRTETILDEVTMKLSNSIMGAMLIGRGAGASLQDVELGAIVRLVVLDFPDNLRSRLNLAMGEGAIFLPADPILLRIGLRNLLDNALHYSPPGSRVAMEVRCDESRPGYTVLVTNTLAGPGLLQGDIFAWGARGNSLRYDGMGLGLFIVRETARVHHGSVTVYQPSPDLVTFELYLPA